MKTSSKLLVVASVAAAACASQGSDSGARLAELEARVTKIEALLVVDASAVAPVGVDAGAEVGAPPAVEGFRSVDGGIDVPTQKQECVKSAEARCSDEIYSARLEQERAKKGPLRWLEVPRAPADSTPKGRACLKREQARCDAAAKGDPVFEWLDAQLVPGRRDEKLTQEMRERVAKQLELPVDKVDVACAPQFCRFIGDTRRQVAFGDDFNHGMSQGARLYMMRRGFEVSH